MTKKQEKETKEELVLPKLDIELHSCAIVIKKNDKGIASYIYSNIDGEADKQVALITRGLFEMLNVDIETVFKMGWEAYQRDIQQIEADVGDSEYVTVTEDKPSP